MPLVVALIVIGVLLGILFYAFAHESPPAPAEVAIAYERAWDTLDLSLLFDLSGAELRDGMKRDAFVAAKRAAYSGHERAIGAQVEVETAVTGRDTALVVTHVASTGGSVRNNVLLERRGGSWVVVEYRLRPDPADRL
jgi:hypothetical protein